MAQDVNQSEMDVAAQVRSALVARISPERFELWVPADCSWQWTGTELAVIFSNEFACQIANRMLLKELRTVLNEVVGSHAQLKLTYCAGEPVQAVVGSQTSKARSLPHTTARKVIPIGVAHANTNVLAPTAVAVGQTASVEQSTKIQTANAIASPASLAARKSPMGSARNAIDGGAPSESADGQSQELGRHKQNAWQEFVPGTANHLAWTTINLVLQEPGRMTPVLLHGPYGVGKSHLATALAQQLRAQKRQRRVLHITAEQFTNDFTEAIRGGGLPVLRRKYRDVDTLILDDVQFLIGKKATINELRHTLDNLLKAGRQVVFLSDRSLNELEPLGSDFVGRLRGGLVSPLLPLDEETRYRLLKRDLSDAQVTLSDEMVRQIAARAVGDGRLLKGISKRLTATAYAYGDSLTWDQCWNSIFDLIQATQPIVRLGDIERVVCEVFGLEPQSLQSDRKTRTVSQPRMLAMFLARKYTPAAYKEIGDFFGNRRHSTVISAEKTVEAWLEENTPMQLPRGSLAIRDAMRHVEATLQVG